MRCLSKKFWVLICVCSILCSVLTGCSNGYDTSEKLHIDASIHLPIVRPSGLASQDVVIPYDAYIYDNDGMEYEAGLLINQTKNTVVDAVNPHKQIYPASMTKIMTAVVVMDAVNRGDISLQDTVVIQRKIEFNEENVLVLGLQPGDYITVDELLHGLLIASYNDCAVALARYVAGSISAFVDLMNEKAFELGATNTHFVNPHGLHDNNHYTTPYDLYLIFKCFLQNDTLVNIDSNSKYTVKFYRDEELVQVDAVATNGFLSDSFEMPSGYHITGWKTGTTEKAGNCIILEFVKEDTDEKFICLVSNATDHETLYQNVEDLLKEIY